MYRAPAIHHSLVHLVVLAAMCRGRFIAPTADSSALGLGSHVCIIVLISINGENVSRKK